MRWGGGEPVRQKKGVDADDCRHSRPNLQLARSPLRARGLLREIKMVRIEIICVGEKERE